jgi:hypothetical protein
MMKALYAAAFAGASLFLMGGTAEAKTLTKQSVGGRLDPVDDTTDDTGHFRMLVKTRGEAVRETLWVDAWHLDTTRDDAGNLPSYHAWVVNADATASADFGEVFLGERGRARLRAKSWKGGFPDGFGSLKDYAGGVVELRLGDTAILRGDIPEFLGIGDANEPGSHSRVKAIGIKRLHATPEGDGAKGWIGALKVNRPSLQVEALWVECLHLGERGDVFTVVAIAGDGTETTLGTMTSRTRFEFAYMKLSTRRGDTIPGGGVLALGGQTVEVRDADGVAHLVGRFPDLDPTD